MTEETTLLLPPADEKKSGWMFIGAMTAMLVLLTLWAFANAK